MRGIGVEKAGMIIKIEIEAYNDHRIMCTYFFVDRRDPWFSENAEIEK